jgi:hypothetical protein
MATLTDAYASEKHPLKLALGLGVATLLAEGIRYARLERLGLVQALVPIGVNVAPRAPHRGAQGRVRPLSVAGSDGVFAALAPFGHKGTKPLGGRRRPPLERPHVAFEERDEAHGRRRDNRRRATSGCHDRDLAEHVSGAECPDRLAVGADLGGAALDREERVPEFALDGERLAVGDRDLVRGGRHRRQVGLVEIGEERDGRKS